MSALDKTKQDEQYSDKEAKARFEAALRGARVAGHKPMKDKPKAAKKTKAKKGRSPR